MSLITNDILQSTGRISYTTSSLFLPYLNESAEEFEINTPLRLSAFLAQIIHESGCFRYTEEIASGSAYEGRADLGNTKPGDGKKYKGRGLIQITGRFNYEKCSKALFGNEQTLIDAPERLKSTDLASRSSAWYWSSHGLNDLADKAAFHKITQKINGGQNGQKQREELYERAKQALGC